MEDVNISKFRAQVVRAGSTPASPGFVVSEGQNPVDPSGSGQNHLPVTIATAATGLSITESQVLGGAGTVGQYIRGDGSLADFPATTGGGSSVSYYLNGSVSQGTIGGVAYKELNRTPVFGTGTDISINADGYIASFITDALDPNKLLIPGGNWNFETYFSASSSGGSPSFYVELYKYDGTTFTLLATSSSAPELIAFGTNLNPYFSTLAVPETVLALTDRLAVRFYVTHSGRTITLHTEDNHLCQVITTFTTGLTALNGLTSQVQFFAVGTSGTDFNIASASDTHTFNLPTATSTIRGALSSADWTTFNNKTSNLGTVTSVGLSSATSGVTIGSTPITTSGTITLAIATASGSQNGLLSSTDWSTFNGKQNALTNPVTGTGTTNYLPKFTGASTIGNSLLFDNGTNVGLGTIIPLAKFHIEGSGSTYTNPNLSDVPGIYIYNTNSSITTANTFLSLRTGGAGGGDPILSWDIDGVIGWTAGIDNSDGDSFKIANNWTALDSSTRLEINGSGRLRLNAYGGGTFTGTATRNLAVDSLGNIIEVIDGGGTVTGTGTTNYLSKFTGTSSIGNSSIFDNGTNVGIGTATNTTALVEIFGTAIQNSTNPGLRLSSSNTSQTVLAIVNTSSKGYELSVAGSSTGAFSGSFYIYDIAQQLTRFVVSSAGNVLVGTTTDFGYKFDVNGTGRYNQNNTSVGNATGIRLEQAGSGDVAISYLLSGVREWLMGVDNSDSDSFKINNITGSGDFSNVGVSIATTGAATFSNTVRATSTGVDGTFADAYIAQYSVTNAEANAIQTSVSGAANSSGFRFQASDGNLSSARTTVVDFLRDRQIFYGNVGINQINPTSRLSVSGDATSIEGLVNINNTKSTGGYFPALKVRNVNGDHTFGVVSEFSTGTTGGDRPTVLFFSTVSNHSWVFGQVSAGWGVADSFGIGYRANNSPNSFGGWPSNYFAITTGGNVLIGTATNGASKLRIVGLPTSAAGLSSGDVYNLSGVLMIA
jgi:hypothetical protein